MPSQKNTQSFHMTSAAFHMISPVNKLGSLALIELFVARLGMARRRQPLVLLFFLVPGLFLPSFASKCQADLVVFTDRTAWETAVGVGNFQTEDFNIGGQAVPIPHNTVSSVGLFDVFYTTLGNVDNIGQRREFDILVLVWEPGSEEMSTTSLELQFRSPINAFGAYFTSISSALTIDPVGVTGRGINIEETVGTEGFVGFISDSSFTTIDITSNDIEEFGIEDASFGFAPIPEPSSVWLLTLGIGFVFSRRRIRKIEN